MELTVPIKIQIHDEKEKEYIEKLVKERDIVAVVRCKNCKKCECFYPEKEVGKEATMLVHFCKLHNATVNPMGFCSCGEREDGTEE